MKTFKGLTLVGSIMLVLAAQGSAAGPATVSSVYTVGALTVPGVNTGLHVRKGYGVTVTATGTVCYFESLCTGPDGDPSLDTTTGAFVLPGAPGVGLIGRVGKGPWVHVGSGSTTLTGNGVLVFAVNDNWFPDNTGSFTVTVSQPCYPGWGYGDANHAHCGPPGLANKPPPPGHSSPDTHGSSNEHSTSADTNGSSNQHGNSPAKGNSRDSNGGSQRP